jgi:hypothetical protein
LEITRLSSSLPSFLTSLISPPQERPSAIGKGLPSLLPSTIAVKSLLPPMPILAAQTWYTPPHHPTSPQHRWISPPHHMWAPPTPCSTHYPFIHSLFLYFSSIFLAIFLRCFLLVSQRNLCLQLLD